MLRRILGENACCGYCREVSGAGAVADCRCERCACGHCVHDHEKCRWHRACRDCTPLYCAGEVPNEVDATPLGAPRTAVVDHCAELDKHRPMDQPLVRCRRKDVTVKAEIVE